MKYSYIETRSLLINKSFIIASEIDALAYKGDLGPSPAFERNPTIRVSAPLESKHVPATRKVLLYRIN